MFADQIFHQHIFWHAQWDLFKIKINMSTTEFDLENVIPVTEANLKDEQKQAIAKAMEDYKQHKQEWRGDPEGSTTDASAGYF